MKAAQARTPSARCTRRTSRPSQRGITLFGLLFWAIVVGFGAYLALRVFPTVNEYWTIQTAVEKIAAAQPPTCVAMQDCRPEGSAGTRAPRDSTRAPPRAQLEPPRPEPVSVSSGAPERAIRRPLSDRIKTP